jgi:hypothetical protein
MSEPTQADRELFIYVADREDCAEDVLIGNCFTWEVDAITKYRIAAMEVGAETERKAIVDWLRKSGYNQIAYCIEKEAHKE